MDVFLTGGAGAAQRVALHRCDRLYTCLGGLDQLMQATLFEGRWWRGGRRRGEEGRWRVMGEGRGGGDQTRSQDLRNADSSV